MHTHWIRTFALYGLCAASLNGAETVGYWRFDDGSAPAAAGTLVTEVNAPDFNGTAGVNGSASLPAFDNDRPAAQIYSRLGGPPLNPANSASLRFVNAGLPADTNSPAGGVVTVPDHALLRASNITVEVFLKVDRRVNWPLVIGKARSGGNTSWNLDFDNTGKPRVRIDSNPVGTSNCSGWNQSWTSSVGVEDGRWHHVAFTYAHSNRAVRIYVDNVQRASGTSFSNLVYEANELRIGQGAGGRAFDGWIDEIRITDDVLVPDQFMTVIPTTVTRGYWMFEDGPAGTPAATLTNTFYAPMLYGTAGTTGGATVKPAFSSERPFATTPRISDGLGGPILNLNAGSLLFVNAGLPDNPNSPSGGVVTVSGSVLPQSMTNFTAEAFVRVNRHVNFPQIIGKSRSGGTAWSLAINSSGNLRARFDTQIPPDNTGNNQSFEFSAKIEDGQWHHVALTYHYPTKTVRLFKDYVKVLESTTVNPVWLDSGSIQIGAGDRAFDGWIDEVRLTDRTLEPDEFLYTVAKEGTIFWLQ